MSAVQVELILGIVTWTYLKRDMATVRSSTGLFLSVLGGFFVVVGGIIISGVILYRKLHSQD